MEQNWTYYHRIWEVKEVLAMMDNGKVIGPNSIPIEVWKCVGEECTI